MQPNNNDADKWQQPSEQPSQTPHVAPPVQDLPQPPVVTLTPEQPVVSQQTPAAPAPNDLQDTATDQEATTPTPLDEPVHWQAHEYIHHDKGSLWFVIFGVVVILLIAIAIFLLKSETFAILIPVMAVALVVYSHRPPRLLDYTISSQGLHVNDHLYSFAEFKGFGVIHDGNEYSVMLIPRKRFKPGVSVYFPEEAGEAIVDMLGSRLPMQELHVDIVDKLIHKLRI